jgi:nitroreductase
MQALEAIHGRRTIRKYRQQSIGRELLLRVLWAAVQAPTPPVSGASAWRICVVEGTDRLAAYGMRAKQYAFEHQPAGQHWVWTERPEFKGFWNAPAAVVFCARTANPEAPFDCCRAAQNMLIAAHAVGLGTCWVGAPLPWLTSPGVAQEVGLPTGFTASAVVLVGYPDEQPLGEPRPEPEVQWC